jgi:hypothetical protein
MPLTEIEINNLRDAGIFGNPVLMNRLNVAIANVLARNNKVITYDNIKAWCQYYMNKAYPNIPSFTDLTEKQKRNIALNVIAHIDRMPIISERRVPVRGGRMKTKRRTVKSKGTKKRTRRYKK